MIAKKHTAGKKSFSLNVRYTEYVYVIRLQLIEILNVNVFCMQIESIL